MVLDYGLSINYLCISIYLIFIYGDFRLVGLDKVNDNSFWKSYFGDFEVNYW